MTARLQPGAVIEVDEQHYCYGLGTLKLRVTSVGRVEPRTDGRWLNLRGHEQFSNGSEGRERFALVRLGAVRIVAQPEKRKS